MSEPARPRPPIALGEGEIQVWTVSPARIRQPAQLANCERLLSEEERARCARRTNEASRHEFLVSHAFLRLVLSQYAAVAPDVWTFRATEHGRPEIAGPDGHGPLTFNLSHTDGLAAVAVAGGIEVGVDVEALDRREVERGFAARFFAPAEVEALERQPEAARRRAFLQLWTLKEAYIKARGLGLALPLHAFAFSRPDGTPAVAFTPEIADDPATWQFVELAPTPEHVLAVAVRRPAGMRMSVQIRDGFGLFREGSDPW